MAILEQTFSLEVGAKQRNKIPAASAREDKAVRETGKDVVISHQLKGPKRRHSRFQWRNRNIFNASAHEVVKDIEAQYNISPEKWLIPPP